jgi:hypothetical protein
VLTKCLELAKEMTTEELSSREYQFNCPQKIVAGSRFHHTTHRLSFEASFIVPANDSCVTQDNFGFWGQLRESVGPGFRLAWAGQHREVSTAV